MYCVMSKAKTHYEHVGPNLLCVGDQRINAYEKACYIVPQNIAVLQHRPIVTVKVYEVTPWIATNLNSVLCKKSKSPKINGLFSGSNKLCALGIF